MAKNSIKDQLGEYSLLSTEEQETEDDQSAHVYKETCCEKYSSCRWTIGYLCCAARFSQSALRQMMGMAIVCMTMGQDHIRNPEVTSEQFLDNATNISKPEFIWTSEFEGLILSSFTFGFIATPVLGGYMASRFGGKRVITTALTIGSIVTMITPIATRIHPVLLVVMRTVVGIFMGTVDPAIQSLWSRWAPKEEKASLTSCTYAGVSIGGVVTFLISGYLGNLTLDNGWPLIFYVFGGFALLCVIPWVFLVSDFPVNHPHISDREVQVITRSQTTSQTGTVHMQSQAIPWRSIVTSSAFLAILVAHVSYSWVASWAMAYLPKYLNQVLGYKISEDGVLSSLPFAGRLVVGVMSGAISDQILKRQYFSTANTRKLFQVIGCLGCASCIAPIGYMNQDSRTQAVCLLALALSLQNCGSVAFRINNLDIAPRHAGVLMGMTTTCAMAVSLSAPLLTSTVVKQGTREEWQIVFWVVVGLNIFGAVIFVIFAKGEEQEWARQDTTTIVTTKTVTKKL